MNRIDPDGKDDWEVNKRGNVKWIKESSIHTLFSLDKNGKRDGNSLTLKDRGIFDQLANKKDGVSKAIKGSESEDAILGAFKFMADNTDVEWRADKWKDGKVSVATQHNERLSPSAQKIGNYTDASIASMIHSHQTNWGSLNAEMQSMGKLDGIDGAYGDWAQAIGFSRKIGNGKQAFPSKVYFKHSKNLYNINIYKGPQFLKNVKSSRGIKF